MDAREQLQTAFDVVREHPRRLLASAAGVYWGAFAIILLLAWGSGFRVYMRGEMTSFGSGFVMLATAATSSGFPGYRAGRAVTLSRADLRAAERENPELIRALLPHHSSRERLLVEGSEGRLRRLDLSASDERFLSLRNFSLAHGREFTAREAARGKAVAVIGPDAALELLGGEAAAVGQSIRIDGSSFDVVGVTARKGRQYFNTHRPDNGLIVVPAAAAEDRLGFLEDDVSNFFLFLQPGVEGSTAVRAARRSLGARGNFHPDDDDAVKSFDATVFTSLIDVMHLGLAVFIGVAGTITLLIGGIGIANYHLATLSERTVEIGVARALGARTSTLVAQVVLESLLLSAPTAFAGVLSGVAGSAALALLIPAGTLPRPIVSLTALFATFIALLAVAVVAALIPALAVRRIEIREALRASV